MVTEAVRVYRMKVIAHRLRKFGFESSINKLSTDDLEALAPWLWQHQKEAVLKEVAKRRASCACGESG